MSRSDTPDDFSEDDLRWLHALRRKVPDPAHDGALDEAAQEALLLSEALARERFEQENGASFDALHGPVLREQRLQALLSELRRQGLLQPVPDANVAPRARARPWWRWAAPLGLAAAAMLAFVAVRPLLLPPAADGFDEPPAWRSAQPEIIRQVAEPLAQAQALRARLESAGLWTALYRQGEAYVLDIEVEPAQLPVLAPLLAAEELPARAGLARIRFVRR